jgi:hypothetical protein
MSLADDIRAARAVIEDPDNWTQGAMALDADGNSTPSNSETAVCFCALGAVRRAMKEPANPGHGRPRGNAVIDALHTVVRETTGQKYFIDHFNDVHSHAEVLAMFDKAIARAEKESV